MIITDNILVTHIHYILKKVKYAFYFSKDSRSQAYFAAQI